MLLNYPEWGNNTWWSLGKERLKAGDYGEALEAWLMIRPELLPSEHQLNVENDIMNNAIAPLNSMFERARIVEAFQNVVKALNEMGRRPQAERVKKKAWKLGYEW